MEWYEIIGVGGGTLIAKSLIDMAIEWIKARFAVKAKEAEDIKDIAEADRARQDTTTMTYQTILDEVKENLIIPLEDRARELTAEVRELRAEIKRVREECEEDKTAILATLDAEREQRSKENHSAHLQMQEMRASHQEEMRKASAQIEETLEIVNSMQTEREELYKGIKIITGQLCQAGIKPEWTPPDPEYYEGLKAGKRKPIL